jgi:hypothetical protein
MNRPHTLFHLKQALEALQWTCTAADFNRWGRFPQELLWSPQDDD